MPQHCKINVYSIKVRLKDSVTSQGYRMQGVYVEPQRCIHLLEDEQKTPQKGPSLASASPSLNRSMEDMSLDEDTRQKLQAVFQDEIANMTQPYDTEPSPESSPLTLPVTSSHRVSVLRS